MWTKQNDEKQQKSIGISQNGIPHKIDVFWLKLWKKYLGWVQELAGPTEELGSLGSIPEISGTWVSEYILSIHVFIQVKSNNLDHSKDEHIYSFHGKLNSFVIKGSF